MTANDRIASLVSIAAGVLTAAAVVLPTSVYFLLSHQRIAGSLEAEAEINARMVSQIVTANPDLWEYEVTRLSEYLTRRPRRGDGEQRLVLDMDGMTVAESADPLHAPVMSRSVALLDAGTQVGVIVISRSLRPLLFRTGILGALLLVVGVISFRIVRTLPLLAIRRSEEALRRERDTAQKYLDVAGVAFVILDVSGCVTLVNPKGAAILGRPESEVLGRRWIEAFVDPDDRARVASETALARSSKVLELEYRVVRPSGERRVVSSFVTPLEDPAHGSTGLLASGVDITDQRKLEDQLRRAHKLEAVGRLAGGVAHDFNNVLSVIKGYAAMMRRQIPSDHPHRRYVDGIIASSDRAASLTRSLLTVGQRQVLHRKATDLVQVVRRSERLLRRLVPEDVDFVIDVPAEPLPVMVDTLQIERVLMNLVTNARDAMRNGGRIVIAASSVSLDEPGAARAGVKAAGPYAQVSVTDSGQGIDPETRARIFEPFFTTKEDGKGTGLGLSIAYGIVKQHMGAIRAASEKGRGATFTFLLPLLGSAAALEDLPEEEEPPGGTETVLLADDDADARSVLRQILEGAGYAVVEAVDGRDAVKRFDEHRDRVRLVILDALMPGQDGRVALEEIRKIDPAMRAVLLGGNGEDDGAQDAALVGEGVLLSKPGHAADVLRAVRKVLDL